jgi:putative holliday junction resolvase
VTSDEKPTGRNPWASHGRLLGVDFGTVRVGLAITDPDRILASPFDTYTRRDNAQDAGFFQRLVANESVVGLVVGLPLHTGGEEGIKAKEAREYGVWLGSVTGLPVVFWDERCTSSAAHDALIGAGVKHKNRKGKIDRIAAQFILQGFIENNV